MRYNLTPNKPRPLGQVHVGATPNTDARWRGLGLVRGQGEGLNRVQVLAFQRSLRNPNPVRNPR